MMWNLFLLSVVAQNYLTVCELYEYHYINEKKTWTEAQQYCREKHTDLATVTNMTDMESLLSPSLGDIKEGWIGLHDQRTAERTWHWSLPGVEYNENETNWEKSTNEPNNKEPGGQNCGIIWSSGSNFFKWGDLSCNKLCHFLCFDDNDASKTFHLIKETKSWLEAQSYCRENHKDLISGQNQIKEENMKTGFDFRHTSEYIFIGLFSDTWKWSDESKSSFRHWNLQFDNQKINSGQCAMAVFDDGGKWKNEDCSVRKPFFCYDKSTVVLIKENKTWEDALSYCRDHHHDLVTITNGDEQRLVQQKGQFASTPFVWMGLTYACTLDLWFWVDDNMVLFNKWAQDGWMDDCDMSGAMETGEQYKWFKKNDTERYNFICSKHRHA